MRRRLWIVPVLSLALLLSLLFSLTVAASPIAPGDRDPSGDLTVVNTRAPVHNKVKSVDQPNIKDYLRNQERQRLLEAGQVAEANALSLNADDRVLVVLVEFAGTDVFTWNPGDEWDPLGIADPSEVVLDDDDEPIVGDCSNIITQTQTFTYTGPLHNEIPRPLSEEDRSGNTIWTEDFSPGWFESFMWGDGVTINYTREDGSVVNEDFTDMSVKEYFLDMSGGSYEISGDVIGWVQVPHSTWYYDADECPGSRSGVRTSRGAIPGAGNSRTLVHDALDAVNAISDTIDGFDWANYDLDGDGEIDRLWIVHAGYGEEDGTTLLNRTDYGESAVWSHSSSGALYEVAPGISAGAYIVMPENGGIGVFAHEYAHNLGADDLYAYGNGETSTGFWALQADDWTGYPIGFQPPSADPWHLDNWGWLEPMVINDPSQVYEVKVAQASSFPGGDDTYRGVKIELPDGLLPLGAPIWQGEYYWWGGSSDLANAMMTTVDPVAIPAEGASLVFDIVYDIEDEWDFLWVQASEDGETWDTLTNADTQCAHDSGWIGEENGFPADICDAGIGGFYGSNADWPDPEMQMLDLAAYAGKDVFLRFWFMTDWGTTYTGVFIDNVKVLAGDTVLFADNAESGDAKWTYTEPWQRSNGLQSFTHNYYLQWRNTGADGGYDSALGDERWRFGPANTGLLMWYNNNFYSDNEIYSYLEDGYGFGPKGRMLVIDAHPEPYRNPDLAGSWLGKEGTNNTTRGQMRDAPFSLWDSVDFRYTDPYSAGAASHMYEGRPAVPSFHDSMGYYPGVASEGDGTYWSTVNWDASAALPATGPYSIAGGPEYPGYHIQLVGGRWLGFWEWPEGGSGNPGDDNVQYGWHVEILEQTASTATLRIWNETNYIEGSLTQTPDADPVIVDTVVDVDAKVANIGGAIDGFYFVRLDPDVEYIDDSAYGGAFPVTAGSAAALAAEHGIAELAEAASVAAAGDVVGVAYMGHVGVGEMLEFGFSVLVVNAPGTIHHSMAIFDGGHFLEAIHSGDLTAEAAPQDAVEIFPAVADSYIHLGLWGMNYDDYYYMHVGASDIARALVQFDVSSINPIYPVTSATLKVFVDAYQGGGSTADLNVYPVTTAWVGTGATWRAPWTVHGGDFMEPAAGSLAIDNSTVGTWVEIDVTDMVQKWVESPAMNNGLMLRLENETSFTMYRLRTNEHWYSETGPMLDVHFETP